VTPRLICDFWLIFAKLAACEWEMAMSKQSNGSKSVDYKAAGVDIEAADELVEHIKSGRPKYTHPGVLGGIGGFGAFFELPWSDYKEPVLVSGTDGCGTKLRLAIEVGIHNTVGIDLVAMCVNDIITSGATPLFFLDYYATGALQLPVAKAVVDGIQVGCNQGRLSLVGGETAEMPGMYQAGDYDLAGFCVGIVEKSQIIDGSQVGAGDALIALASSGVHANGFSLVRHVCAKAGVSWDEAAWSGAQQSLGQVLLEPTKIYVDAVSALQAAVPVHALAHITGGGLADNLVRVLPGGVRAQIDASSWEMPAIFQRLAQMGPIDQAAMRQAFNCGVGMVAVVPADSAQQAIAALEAAGEQAWVCGHVETGSDKAEVVWNDG
jgi:phosphoribosylformylglycinamidine cyclo-ligase